MSNRIDVLNVLSTLQSAAENWENAVDDVQTALSELRELEESMVPEPLLRALGLLRDGGFASFVEAAGALEPDLNPPQNLREMADDMLNAAE